MLTNYMTQLPGFNVTEQLEVELEKRFKNISKNQIVSKFKEIYAESLAAVEQELKKSVRKASK